MLRAFLLFLLFVFPPLAQGSPPSIKNRVFDQGRLAFTLTRGKDKDIFVLDFGDQSIKALVSTKVVDEYPTWSPDGRYLAFYSDICGDREIFSIHSDGTELRRLSFRKGLDEDPSWSPDGKKLVYYEADASRSGSVSQTRIVSINREGKKRQVLFSSSKKNTVPRWSPRGDEILFSTNEFWPGWDIRLLQFGVAKPQTLTSGLLSYCRGSWHPDGGSFAFSYGSGKDIDIWIQTKGADTPERATSAPGREYDAVYTEDGTGLFYAGETGRGTGKFQAFYHDLRNGKSVQITDGSGSIRHLSWTPLPGLPQAREVSVPNQGLNNAFIEKEVCQGKVVSRKGISGQEE